VDVDLPSVDHVGQTFLRRLAEGLSLLRRVNFGKADLVLMPFGVQDRDSIAMGEPESLPCRSAALAPADNQNASARNSAPPICRVY
jgi:hypothetical protein